MNANRLIQEADAVAWIERSKGNCRAAAIIEAMAVELRRLWDAGEDRSGERIQTIVQMIRERRGTGI